MANNSNNKNTDSNNEAQQITELQAQLDAYMFDIEECVCYGPTQVTPEEILLENLKATFTPAQLDALRIALDRA